MRHFDQYGLLTILSEVLRGRHLWQRLLLLGVYACVTYYAKVALEVSVASVGHSLLGSAVAYLLAARLSAALSVFQERRQTVCSGIGAIREVIMVAVASVQGGAANKLWRQERSIVEERRKAQQGDDIRASTARVNLVRWSLAFLVALRLQCRLKPVVTGAQAGLRRALLWDRIRLRTLLTRPEFEMVNELSPICNEPHVTRGTRTLTEDLLSELLRECDAAQADLVVIDRAPEMSVAAACMARLRMEVMAHVGEAWGFSETVAQQLLELCERASGHLDSAGLAGGSDEPAALGWQAPLCAAGIWWFLVATPLVVDVSLGLLGGLGLPLLAGVGFLGAALVAEELERPYGDGDFEALDALEAECLRMLEFSGDTHARAAFASYEVPDEVRDLDSNCDPSSFVCLRSQVQADYVTEPPEDIHVDRLSIKSPREPPKEEPKPEPVRKGRASSKQRQGSLEESLRGSAGGFKPMEEFGTETLILEEQDEDFRDCVGLDGEDGDDEEDGQASGQALSTTRQPASQRHQSFGKTSSQHGFQMMPDFGTQTIHLEEHVPGEMPGEDVVGLSDGEEDDEDDEPLDTLRKVKSKSSVTLNLVREESPGDEDEGDKLDDNMAVSASMRASGAFLALPDFGTQTINLEEAGLGDEEAEDVVGLDDEEEAEEDEDEDEKGDFDLTGSKSARRPSFASQSEL